MQHLFLRKVELKIPGKLGEQQYKNMHQLQQLENTIQLNKYKFNCLFGELLMWFSVYESNNMIFTKVIYGFENWTIKKTEHWKIYAFEMWCWRRILRVTWTARKSNQSILKEINSEYSLEGLMLKLTCQNFGHLIQRDDSLEKILMLGKIEVRRRRG